MNNKTKNSMMVLVTIVVIVLIVLSCVWIAKNSDYNNEDGIKSQINKVVYEEDGVVCWVLKGYSGISCLPISETNIGK
jgi:hypothetical protein